ncbi:hypothetical protein KDN24_06050 [Bacillus sp. Bva_UNVM-123]|uniref:hypothetical protein n=1 Tax=Bacillus sp. Bva_UNVM-123 TaxID=2829798 RepID=UPI00391F7728
MEKSKRHKTEFSKKVIMFSYAIGIVIILYAMYIQLLIITKDYHGDSGIVIALISGAFAEMATVTGFYKWKAMQENKIKLTEIYGKEIVEGSNIEIDQEEF